MEKITLRKYLISKQNALYNELTKDVENKIIFNQIKLINEIIEICEKRGKF